LNCGSLPNWLHRKIGKKNVIQGLGHPFFRGEKLPQKKNPKYRDFCQFEITEKREIKGKKKIKKNLIY
jgi:hypothetical protein